MKRWWNYISHLGTDHLTSNLHIRAIIMANRLNMILFLVGNTLFVLSLFISYQNGQDIDFYTTRLLLLSVFNIGHLLLSRYGYLRLMQISTSMVPVFVIILIPALLGYVQDSSFFYYQIVVLGFSLLPQIVFVPRKDNATYWVAMSFYFLIMLFLDDAMIAFTNSSQATIEVIRYFKVYYKLIPLVIFIFLHLALFYLRSINVEYEEKLVRSNEVLTQNIQELNKAQEKLIRSEKMATIGFLSSGLAHEINNPLNFIKGGINALTDYTKKIGLAEAEQIQALTEIVDEGVHRASKIIQSLGHFSSEGEDAMGPCDIREIISNCLIVLKNDMNPRINVTVKSTDFPVIKDGSEGRLHQAFLGVLSNAMDAIRGEGTVQIDIKVEGLELVVVIEDDGIGIEDENQSKVMEPFFTTKIADRGTGLGLSIADTIFKEHNGSIDFHSDFGSGTVFTIRLPIA